MKKIIITLFFCLFVFAGNSFSKVSNKPVKNVVQQGLVKFPGFMGFYSNSTGTIYGGFGLPAGELIQRAFNFGENAIISQSGYYGYTFLANLDSNCINWDANKIYGILRPPSEKGAVNQPGDTSLFQPFTNYPGMIQGAHRFSELSKIYPQIQGVIIDDFYSNYPNSLTVAQLQEIKDALLGKQMDANGNIDPNSKATTPNLKLYIVAYTIPSQMYMVDPNVLKLIDGVNLWCATQNADYQNYDNYVNIVKKNYPGKDIIAGIYILNSIEAMTPESIHFLYRKDIDLYNNGNISDIYTFAAIWLTQQYITQTRWDSLAIPPLLDSVYYPYLGEASGKVIDAQTGQAVQNALVTIRRINSQNPLIVSQKFTKSSGGYDFGAWSGKDSIISYQISVEDSSFKSNSIDVQLQAGKEIVLPDIKLQAVTGVHNEGNFTLETFELKQNYPNPYNPSTEISYTIPEESYVALKVYNFLGQEVSTLVNKILPAGSYHTTFTAGSLPSGVYFYSLRSGNFTQVKKMILLK